jgi:protease-4
MRDSQPPRPRRGLLFLFLSVCAAPAGGQPIPRGEPPTPGVYNPTIGLASDGDASAVDKNPALLGFQRSWSGVYLHSELDGGGTVGGRGDGFFASTQLPYLTSLAVGAGVQLLRPPASFPYAGEVKLSLALAWRILPALSFGLSYAHLASDKGPVAGGLDTLDLALALRIGRHFSTALVVRDVPSPAVAGLPLQRVYDPELAIRPFGTDALEIGVGARFGERRGDIDPHFRAWLTPRRGLTIKADVELRRDVDLDGILENDVRVALGLQLDLEHVGLAGFGLFGRDSGFTQGHGFTLAARVSGERYGALFTGPARLEKIDLTPETTSRALVQLLCHLRRLERESSIVGVVVVVGELGGGWATAEELRAALLRLRRARKHVYVYATETSTRGYYVASAAERIYLDPAGGLDLTGLASHVTFWKGTGDLIGVRADFVKIGEYKSAPEAYTRTTSSPPARAQRDALYDDVYRNLTEAIAASRHVAVERVKKWIDDGPYTPPQAEAAGLVDESRAGDELEGAIAQRLGRHVLLREAPRTPERDAMWMKPKVAVLFVEGDITTGKSQTIPILDAKFVGLQSLVPAIERAREDPRVKALVLRVDSPGGSALASDLIARELERTRAVKPVVCSLGDVAASGGYFIAAPCQRIFAAPSTLTGSIGIFTGKFDVSGLAQKLGVSTDHFERGRHAGIESMWRLYTEEERRHIMDKLKYYYQRFVDTVARCRGLRPEDVDARGRGHVYSGVAALREGLIDEYGGAADAVAEAMRLAGLSTDSPVELYAEPEERTLFSQLLGLLGLSEKASATVTQIIPGVADVLRGIPGSLLLEPSTPQARLEEDLLVR